MPRKSVIAVVGSGTDRRPSISNAREIGRLIALKGWVLINGGRNAGVMKAANEGAKEAGGLTVGILPDLNADIPAAVDVAIFTDTGQARNNIIVLSADAVIACGVDGAGTTSEVALALKNGKPVILLGAGDVANNFFASIGGRQLHLTDSCEEAIAAVEGILARR